MHVGCVSLWFVISAVYCFFFLFCFVFFFVIVIVCVFFFFFQAEDGIRDLVRSRGLGDVYKRQTINGPL